MWAPSRPNIERLPSDPIETPVRVRKYELKRLVCTVKNQGNILFESKMFNFVGHAVGNSILKCIYEVAENL